MIKKLIQSLLVFNLLFGSASVYAQDDDTDVTNVTEPEENDTSAEPTTEGSPSGDTESEGSDQQDEGVPAESPQADDTDSDEDSDTEGTNSEESGSDEMPVNDQETSDTETIEQNGNTILMQYTRSISKMHRSTT